MIFGSDQFSLNQAKEFGLIPDEDIKTALSELVAAGVLVKKEGDLFEPLDLKRIEVDEYLGRKSDSGDMPVMRSDEKKRNLLASSIQKTYYAGHMAYSFYKLIDMCLYDYHFEDEVVYALFEEGKERRMQFIVPRMYDLAGSWYEKGYSTRDSLKEYYGLRTRRKEITATVGRILRRRLNDFDLEHINRWAEVYGADAAIVEYACRQCEWRGEIRTVDVGNKLKEWFDAGVFALDKAAVYEAEQRKENKSRASRRRGRTNMRRTGKEAGITASESGPQEMAGSEAAVSKDIYEDSGEKDSILDMFGGGYDEDNN